MSQLKVFEFAKQVGIETLVLMDKIKEWKLPIKNHMALLDEEMIDALKNRLKEEASAKEASTSSKKGSSAKSAKSKKVDSDSSDTEKPKKTKRTATKTVTKKATVDKDEKVEPQFVKATGKKIIKKSSSASSATLEASRETTTLIVDSYPAAVSTSTDEAGLKKSIKSPSVIRRKASDVSKVEPADVAPSDDSLTLNSSSDSQEGSQDSNDSSFSASATPLQRRTNIIGRMDLTKARPPAGAVGVDRKMNPGSAGPNPTRPGGLQRNIRTGFVAAPPSLNETINLEREYEEERRREREKEKRRPVPIKEEIIQNFNAADFRKREVIFQPKKKKVASGTFKKTEITTPKASKRVVEVDGMMKVVDLALALNIKAPLITKKLMQGGMMVTPQTDLDFDTISLIVADFDYEAINVKKSADELMQAAVFGELEAEPVHRPPVVTVMGHVDHGKTSLLDAIRKTNVVSGEAGGITQHIGAYKVSVSEDKTITFLDTPGHEAFTAMRARGANVTDVAIIVVAADDGVMPQTVEAINHAKAAQVPIVIAVNKIDKPGANVDKIKQQLTEFEIIPEEWGGTHIFCEVSALQKKGIKELLEQILLVAEVEDLKANPRCSGTGTVIEARLEKGRGPVATVLVANGTVRIGDSIVSGVSVGRVRAMMNDKGEQVKVALPGDPVEIIGFSETPSAGDLFVITQNEDVARKIKDTRAKEIEDSKNKGSKGVTLEDLYGKVKQGQTHELALVLKADVSGSIEALRGMIEKASTDEVKVKIIHTGVGGISESDVLLASTAKGVVIGFNVRPDTTASQRAKEKAVEIKTYSVVYELIADLKKAMTGLLQPDRVEKQTARAEVREVFTVPKIGSIAGCAVTTGKITRSDYVRLLRDNVVVYEGKIASLRRFKDDVKEVAQGYECGIGIENFNDIKVGDVIEGYVIEEIQRTL